MPGSAPPNDNLFRIAQAVSRVPKSPRDWALRFEREQEIEMMLAVLATPLGRLAR